MSLPRIPLLPLTFWRWRRQERREGFDRLCGTDTSVGLREFLHMPITLREFDAAMSAVPIDPTSVVFFDVGCGKGRALLLASRRPFRRVIGVERVPAVAQVAQRNLERCRDPERRCGRVEVQCVDANQCPLPDQDTLYFLYNPFGRHVLARWAERVLRHARERELRITILYVNPWHARVLDASAQLRRIAAAPRWVVYDNHA